MLRWLKTVVVSDEEKAHVMRQAGTWKTTTAEASLFLRRHQNRGDGECPGMSLADTRLLARWCPACRWREPGLRRSCGTWEGAPGYCCFSGGGRECPGPGSLPGRGREYCRRACWRTGS